MSPYIIERVAHVTMNAPLGYLAIQLDTLLSKAFPWYASLTVEGLMSVILKNPHTENIDANTDEYNRGDQLFH